MDLDTFFTTVYVICDDWYQQRIGEQMKRHRDVLAAYACLQQDLGLMLSENCTREVVDCAPARHCSLSHALSHDRLNTEVN